MTHVETYIPLYRKYRPQSFADLVGQEAISQTLGNALQLSKVAHAYLFCGPRGTGKTSTARIFAKSLNCESGPTVSPCQTCASCTGITQGNALDVIEFDAASNNGVEDARELIESCQFAPMAGRFKIYIIDEVHMLTSQAFNALLKTLEEPPPNVVFIFATTEAHKVLPTIISRCQRFDFNRITAEDIVNRLHTIATQETININQDALELIARHAKGGLRDAVGLLDQIAVLGKAKPDTPLTQKDLALLIGSLEEDILLNVVDTIAQRRPADLLHQINTLVNRGVEPAQLAKELIQHFRNLLIAKTVGPQADPKALSMSADFFQALSAQTQHFSPEELPQILNQLSITERNVRNTQQPQLWLEVGLLSLAYREDILLVQDLAKRVEALEAMLKNGALTVSQPGMSRPAQPHTPPQAPSFQPPPVQQAPVQQTPVHSAPVQQAPVQQQPVTPPTSPAAVQPSFTPVSSGTGVTWHDVCDRVPSPPTRALLKQFFFLQKVNGDEVTVGCTVEVHLNAIKKADKTLHLQKALDSAFGQTMKLTLVLDKAGAPQSAMLSSHPSATPIPADTPVAPPIQTIPLPNPVSHEESPPDPLPVMTAPMASIPEAAPEAVSEVLPEAVMETAPPAETTLPMSSQPVAQADPDMPPDIDAPPEDTPLTHPPEPALEPAMIGAPAMPFEVDTATGTHPDMMEAKKFTLELLQGKVLE